MGFIDDAKFVILGKRNGVPDSYASTQKAIGNFEMGDLDYPTRGIGNEMRNSNPHYERSNQTKILKTLADLRLDVFSIPQLAGHLRADPTQIQDVINEMMADGIIQPVQGQQGMFVLSRKMKQPRYNPPNNPPSPSHNPYTHVGDSAADNIVMLKKAIEEQLFVLNKKIDFWASQIQSKNDIDRKQKKPNTVISEFKGKILEIVNTLKVIEMPGSDRDLGELILQYKEARRDQMIAKERELGYEVIDRLDGMVSVYLHLTRTYNDFNKYMIDLYREGIIKDFDEGDDSGEEDDGEEQPVGAAPQQQTPAPVKQPPQPQQRLPPTPPQSRTPEVTEENQDTTGIRSPSAVDTTVGEDGGEEGEGDISQYDESGGGDFADEELDDNQ